MKNQFWHSSYFEYSTIQRVLAGFLLVFIFNSCTDSDSKLIIATSANAQFAMEEIANQFSEQTNVTCELVVGSSGKLTSQIMFGAPYDIFVSADSSYPNKLYREGYSEDLPKNYCRGKVVLWCKHGAIALKELLEYQEVKIACPNPDLAPYGRVTKEVLINAGLWKAISPQLVYTESVAGVNALIASGVCELAFTSYSSVFINQNDLLDHDNITILSEGGLNEVFQSYLVVSNDRNEKQKMQFQEFMETDAAKVIFEKYGYETHE